MEAQYIELKQKKRSWTLSRIVKTEGSQIKRLRKEERDRFELEKKKKAKMVSDGDLLSKEQSERNQK